MFVKTEPLFFCARVPVLHAFIIFDLMVGNDFRYNRGDTRIEYYNIVVSILLGKKYKKNPCEIWRPLLFPRTRARQKAIICQQVRPPRSVQGRQCSSTSRVRSSIHGYSMVCFSRI